MPENPLAVHTNKDSEELAGSLEEKLLGEAGVGLAGRRCQTEDEVIELAREAEVILNGVAPITRRVLESLPRCLVVARYGVGVDNVDLEAATEQGIALVYVPDYSIEEVSNHVIALILTWAKQVVVLDQAVRRGQWEQRFAVELQSVHGQTLGVIGAGRIGMATARKAMALSMDVVVYDPYVDPTLLEEK